MGLGKTLDIIALILTNFEQGKPLAVPVAGMVRPSRVSLPLNICNDSLIFLSFFIVFIILICVPGVLPCDKLSSLFYCWDSRYLAWLCCRVDTWLVDTSPPSQETSRKPCYFSDAFSVAFQRRNVVSKNDDHWIKHCCNHLHLLVYNISAYGFVLVGNNSLESDNNCHK